jgi:hypothetical protein
MRNTIYVCKDCGFADSHGHDADSPDKCPYCRSDDWVSYERQTDDDFDQDDYEVDDLFDDE